MRKDLETKIFDRAALDQLRELEDDGCFQVLVVELISMFLSSTPQQIDDMLIAARTGNFPRVRKIAHTMKSGAANLGAMRFAESCGNLEIEKSLNETNVKERVSKIQADFDEVRTEFERELSNATKAA